MEVSLAALMRNLHVQLRMNLGTMWLCSLVFNYMAKVLFILLHKNQPGVWTQNLQSPEKPFRGRYSLCCQGVAWGSLCWFSSRQGRQCAVDLRNGSSQAREPCSCVVRWPPWQDTAVGWFSLGSDPALWLRVHWFQSWGWNCSYGRVIKYWSMQRLVDWLGASFPWDLHLPSFHCLSTITHLQFPNPFSFIGVRSSCITGCVCHCIPLLLLLFSVEINLLSSLKNTSKNGGK